MYQTSSSECHSQASAVAVEPSGLATHELQVALAFPPAPITDNGRICFGAQAPMFAPSVIADSGNISLGAQAPMFLPNVIADAGLVRLGAQSPMF